MVFFIYHFENIHLCFSYQANIYLRPDYARHFTKLINKVNYTQMHKSSLGQSYICHKWSLILRKNKYKQVREKIILRPNAILLLTVLAKYAFYYWSWLVPQQRMIHCMYILRVSTAKLQVSSESMRRRPLLGASDIHRTLTSITFNMMFWKWQHLPIVSFHI